jgi:hypothetical protein
MKFYEYINNFNFFINFKLFFVEELIVVFMFYNFVKLIIMGSIVELIWPTQFFNRRHSTGFSAIRYRTLTETVIKLRRKSRFYKAINKILYKHRFFKRK